MGGGLGCSARGNRFGEGRRVVRREGRRYEEQTEIEREREVIERKEREIEDLVGTLAVISLL